MNSWCQRQTPIPPVLSVQSIMEVHLHSPKLVLKEHIRGKSLENVEEWMKKKTQNKTVAWRQGNCVWESGVGQGISGWWSRELQLSSADAGSWNCWAGELSFAGEGALSPGAIFLGRGSLMNPYKLEPTQISTRGNWLGKPRCVDPAGPESL